MDYHASITPGQPPKAGCGRAGKTLRWEPDGKSPYVEVACSLACATSGESTIRIVSACDG
jgi:hypothetical protein